MDNIVGGGVEGALEMAYGDHRNYVEGDRLWDADGHEWTRHIRWMTLAQVRSFMRGDHVVGLIEATFTAADDGSFRRPLGWMQAEQARRWWQHAGGHFEVPGSRKSAAPDDSGFTWAAHAWKRDDERRMVFEAFC